MAKVKDVVCGMMVDPETAAAQAEYKGATYYFCAPGCKAAFEKDPEKYLQGEAGGSQAGGHQHHHGH
jgi:YHS domain-containing protein